MAKRSEPAQMVKDGRYAAYFPTLDADVQADALARLGQLVEEEGRWCDEGNYGHLCNLLTAIALYETLRAPQDRCRRRLGAYGEHLTIGQAVLQRALPRAGQQRQAERAEHAGASPAVCGSCRGWSPRTAIRTCRPPCHPL